MVQVAIFNVDPYLHSCDEYILGMYGNTIAEVANFSNTLE